MKILILFCAFTLSAATLSQGPYQPLGATKVVTPGTPVSLLNQFTTNAPVMATSITLQADCSATGSSSGNTGKVFLVVGSTAADTTHWTNVLAILTPGTSTTIAHAAQDINLSNLYLDATTANDCAVANITNWGQR